MNYKTLVQLLAVLLCVNTIYSLNIISKTQWGGRPSTSRTALVNSLPYVIIHHTAGAYCSTQADCIKQMRNMQSYHMDSLGWADIGYNFLIGGDGQVYEGRGWHNMGAHAVKWNAKSIGIAFMGNYNINRPTTAQLAAAKSLIALAVARGQIKEDYILYGHRQVGSTECPGNNLYAEIKKWSSWKVKL